MSDGGKPRVALPIGDPAGIGPEIVLKALTHASLRARCDPTVIGDAGVLRLHADRAGLDVAVTDDGIDVAGLPPVPLISPDLIDAAALRVGTVDAAAGAACIKYAEIAVKMALAGTIDAVVAAPHTEQSVNLSGLDFQGYPRLIAQLTGTDPDAVFLMLLSADFRIVNATLHLPLSDAIAKLDTALIGRAIDAAAAAMRRLGFAHPTIGVCGLNPHAGENGLFGTEDRDMVAPAVAAARARGHDVTGPTGADSLLAARAHDVYIALYHDQGHIPVKVTAPHESSAITIGTPVLFGSVAHGSAHDIAGLGRASEAALVGAVERLATDMVQQTQA